MAAQITWRINLINLTLPSTWSNALNKLDYHSTLAQQYLTYHELDVYHVIYRFALNRSVQQNVISSIFLTAWKLYYWIMNNVLILSLSILRCTLITVTKKVIQNLRILKNNILEVCCQISHNLISIRHSITGYPVRAANRYDEARTENFRREGLKL